MVFSRRSSRIDLDPDGRYRIAIGDPVPILMSICIADQETWGDVGGMRLLDVIQPGESATISLGFIELHWTGPARSKPLKVTYELPADALRHPLKTFYMKSTESWDTSEVLRLDNVPTSIHELHIDDRVLPVDLTTGQTRIDVDLGSLGVVPR
jgi:hypothetical protein